MFFDVEVTISERFQGITPLSIRKEKAREVFLLIRRLSKYNRTDKKTGGERIIKGNKEIIRVKAPDTWF